MAAERAAACHGSEIQADDCCTPTTAAQAVEVIPLGPAVVPLAAAMELQPKLEPAAEHLTPAGWERSATPFYTLFRALLI